MKKISNILSSISVGMCVLLILFFSLNATMLTNIFFIPTLITVAILSFFVLTQQFYKWYTSNIPSQHSIFIISINILVLIFIAVALSLCFALLHSPFPMMG